MQKLQEDTRNIFINKSKNVDLYKNQQYGKNRMERKRFSKVANTTKHFNQINMDDLIKRDILSVTIPVTGESDSYEVSIQLEGVMTELQKNIKANKNIFEYKVVIQALTKVFNTANIKVKCTCADFKYRYAHNLIINNNSVDDTSKDPGPGSTGITAEMKGQGCKHILLVLSNLNFLMQIASVIKNYINWMAENKKSLFLKFIFPKLYGMDSEEAEGELVPEDVKLDSEKDIIDTINKWAKDRGKFVKSSNINPVYADKLEKEQKK